MPDYKITEHSRIQARKQGVSIRVSKNKKKKIDVFSGGKLVESIGDRNYLDYGMYLKKKGKKFADERRRLYHIRHSKDKSFASTILW